MDTQERIHSLKFHKAEIESEAQILTQENFAEKCIDLLEGKIAWMNKKQSKYHLDNIFIPAFAQYITGKIAYSVTTGILEALFLKDEKYLPIIREALARIGEQIEDPDKSWSYFHISEDEYNYLRDVTQSFLDYIEATE